MMDQQPISLGVCIKLGTNQIEEAGSVTARSDAEILAAHALNIPRNQLYFMFDHMLNSGEYALIKTFYDRRALLEPVAYITGVQEFWSLDFKVTPSTLIPRPDSEILVEAVLKYLKATGGINQKRTILDLGTGTGCILLSLLSECPNAIGIGVDVTTDAVQLAKDNAHNLGLGDRTQFRQSDWFDAVEAPNGGFDVIVSNPPYIPLPDMDLLMPDVKNFEPTLALLGGHDGLEMYRSIIKRAGSYLASNGCLAFEVGVNQVKAVAGLMQSEGFRNPTIENDLGGIARVVLAKK